MKVTNCPRRPYIALAALSLVAMLAGMSAIPAFSLPNCGTAEKLTVPAGRAGCDIQLGVSNLLDQGTQTSVAMVSTGIVFEAHKSSVNDSMWYHVGKLNGNSVDWGPNRSITDTNYGFWPTVVMSEDGFVLLVYSNQPYRDAPTYKKSEQMYRVGWIDPKGDKNQSIFWLTWYLKWDGGFHTGLSMDNKDGLIVGVHESDNRNNHTLYYRIGHFRRPNPKNIRDGNYEIDWNSGAGAVSYETGINPHIAVNDKGQVVEVHQVPDENKLHYVRGQLSNDHKSIIWGSAKDHPQYTGNGLRPSVVLMNNGLVFEVHQQGNNLARMAGKLSSDSVHIDFPADSPFVFDPQAAAYPAIAGNGSYVVQTSQHPVPGEVYPDLYFSVSAIRDRNNWMGDMMSSIGNKSFRDIVIPASHDAGMYCSNAAGLPGRTQDHTIYEQLQEGVRYFDLRVKSGDPQRIYHGISTVYCDPVSTVIGDVRNFMAEGHKEVVVLKFSHFLNFGDCRATNDYNILRATITQRLDPWLYRAAGDHPAQISLESLTADGGKVIVVVDNPWASSACGQEEAGFFPYMDWQTCVPNTKDCGNGVPLKEAQFTVYDQYSDTIDDLRMMRDQLDKFANFNGKMKNNSSIQCDLFLMSWTLTPLTDVAGWSMRVNPMLAPVMNTVGRNRNDLIPNILYVDYSEQARVTDTAVAMTSDSTDELNFCMCLAGSLFSGRTRYGFHDWTFWRPHRLGLYNPLFFRVRKIIEEWRRWPVVQLPA